MKTLKYIFGILALLFFVGCIELYSRTMHGIVQDSDQQDSFSQIDNIIKSNGYLLTNINRANDKYDIIANYYRPEASINKKIMLSVYIKYSNNDSAEIMVVTIIHNRDSNAHKVVDVDFNNLISSLEKKLSRKLIIQKISSAS